MSAQAAARLAKHRSGGGRVLSVRVDNGIYHVKLLQPGGIVQVIHVSSTH